MRELLVLCPRMPPYNGADAQRVRTMLPHLEAHGWHATVVALDAASDAGAQDSELCTTLAADAQIVRVSAWSRAVAGRFGIRQPSLRAFMPMRRALGTLLDAQRFDAGLVSTTDFPLWPLCLRWPFPVLLDWQDPWLSTYYDRHPQLPRPGGRLRFAAMQAIARRFEPKVARHASAHLVVSAGYSQMLCSRYPDLEPSRFEVLPFAASAADLALARRDPQRPKLLQARRRWWVAAGRGGNDLHFALGALFEALAAERALAPQRFSDFGLLFVGTAYDAAQTATPLAALAARHGVGDLVVEHPQRVGLLETYRLLDAAEAILVPGSDDPHYVASKLAPCVLTGRPLLGAFHWRSGAHALAACHSGTSFLGFDPLQADASAALREAMRSRWFAQPLPAPAQQIALGDLEASGMATRVCAVLDRIAAAAR